MKIDDFIFTDGIVRKLTLNGNALDVSFEDYKGKHMNLRLTGVLELKVLDCFDHDIAKSRLTTTNERSCLEFFDDTNTLVLRVTFNTAEIQTTQ